MFKKFSIQAKLIYGFLAVSIIAAVIGIFGSYQIKKLDSGDQMMYDQVAMPLEITTDIASNFQKVRIIYRDIIEENDPAKVQLLSDSIHKVLQILSVDNKKFKDLILTDAGKAIYSRYEAGFNEMGKHVEELIALALVNKDAEAMVVRKVDLRTATRITEKEFLSLVSLKVKVGGELSDTNTSQANQASIIMISLIFIGVILAMGLGLLIAFNIKKINKQLLAETNQLVDAAVAGNLSQRADLSKINFEFRAIPEGINKTLDAVIGPLNVAAQYVDLISKGNIPQKITDNYNGDFNAIKNNLNVCIDSVNALVSDANMLAQAAIDGKFSTRADIEKHSGDFRKIVEGVNATLDSIVDKTVWYESIIDAVPFPIHVTDENMSWTYMNKAFEKLMIEQGVVKSRESGYGMACSNAGANICNTANCGIKQLLKGNNQSFFDWCGMSCKQDTAYLKNAKGENTGFVEVVTDLTSIIRVSDYTKAEVERIESNLKHLSNGSLNFDLNIKQSDSHTEEVRKQFERINTSLIQVKDAVGELVNDASLLSKAAVDGRLATRADVSRHQGDFRKIVEGVNSTLDAVIGPLNVAALYVDKIAKGDMPEFIVENYNGDFNNIKNNLNSLIKSFNEIITKAKMVAQGDLTVTLAKRSDNDELMAALSEMVARLSEIVTQVMEAAQNVATSSNEMSKSAVQISEGANEQSASAEQVSSSIEEMASSIQQNSDNSVATEKIAVSSAQGMMDVNTSAQKSLDAMRQISEKIKVINDIAGKTDILAINAAIEAARAGEQGKGFAVVAAEVRKLAEVSQKAAIEINELSASTLKITEESGALMTRIIPEIQKTAQLVKEIAASSHEQRSGSEQITKAVMQFTQVTQQNAAAAEEMSSSSEELAGQAELLKDTIGFFNTGKQVKIEQSVKPAHKTVKGRQQGNSRQQVYRQHGGVNIELGNSEKDDNLFENF